MKLNELAALLERRGDDDAVETTCCPYCGCDFPVDGDGLMVEHIHPRKPDAVCPGTGRRCKREVAEGDDDAARVRRVRQLADELDADAKRHDDAEPIDDGGLTRMILAARFSRDAARRIRRALDGDDTGSGQ